MLSIKNFSLILNSMNISVSIQTFSIEFYHSIHSYNHHICINSEFARYKIWVSCLSHCWIIYKNFWYDFLMLFFLLSFSKHTFYVTYALKVYRFVPNGTAGSHYYSVNLQCDIIYIYIRSVILFVHPYTFILLNRGF